MGVWAVSNLLQIKQCPCVIHGLQPTALKACHMGLPRQASAPHASCMQVSKYVAALPGRPRLRQVCTLQVSSGLTTHRSPGAYLNRLSLLGCTLCVLYFVHQAEQLISARCVFFLFQRQAKQCWVSCQCCFHAMLTIHSGMAGQKATCPDIGQKGGITDHCPAPEQYLSFLCKHVIRASNWLWWIDCITKHACFCPTSYSCCVIFTLISICSTRI